MRRRLKRAPKVGGIPISMATAKSLSRAASDLITNQRADAKERQQRLWVCQSCPERQGIRCGLCGCFLKSKSMLKNSECPIGKWSTLTSESAIDDAGSTETHEE